MIDLLHRYPPWFEVTQLANLAELPPIGALIVVAPLRLVGGTGSPSRVVGFA